MTLEGLSSACAKLEPATSKINEIFEINILQKFTSHALFTPQRGLFILWHIYDVNLFQTCLRI